MHRDDLTDVCQFHGLDPLFSERLDLPVFNLDYLERCSGCRVLRCSPGHITRVQGIEQRAGNDVPLTDRDPKAIARRHDLLALEAHRLGATVHDDADLVRVGTDPDTGNHLGITLDAIDLDRRRHAKQVDDEAIRVVDDETFGIADYTVGSEVHQHSTFYGLHVDSRQRRRRRRCRNVLPQALIIEHLGIVTPDIISAGRGIQSFRSAGRRTGNHACNDSCQSEQQYSLHRVLLSEHPAHPPWLRRIRSSTSFVVSSPA